MRDRILRLCKRLDKFTIEEIVSIAEDIEESVLELMISTFVQERKLIQQGELFIYNKMIKKGNNYSLFKYYPPIIIDVVIKSFCVPIPAYKAALISGVGEVQAMKLYNIFRTAIYKRQYEKLIYLYKIDPQKSRNRMFFNSKAYFYTYNDNIYVIDTRFKNENERIYTVKERKEFQKVYCYLSRIVKHNKNETGLFLKLAEGIWRKDKVF